MLKVRLFRTSEPRRIEENPADTAGTYAKPQCSGLVRFPSLRIDQVMQQHQFVDTRELIEERLF